MDEKSSYRLTRMRAGLNQIEAATKVGIRPPALSAIERGRVTPRIGTLVKMADAYECSLDELMGRQYKRRA